MLISRCKSYTNCLVNNFWTLKSDGNYASLFLPSTSHSIVPVLVDCTVWSCPDTLHPIFVPALEHHTLLLLPWNITLSCYSPGTSHSIFHAVGGIPYSIFPAPVHHTIVRTLAHHTLLFLPFNIKLQSCTGNYQYVWKEMKNKHDKYNIVLRHKQSGLGHNSVCYTMLCKSSINQHYPSRNCGACP